MIDNIHDFERYINSSYNSIYSLHTLNYNIRMQLHVLYLLLLSYYNLKRYVLISCTFKIILQIKTFFYKAKQYVQNLRFMPKIRINIFESWQTRIIKNHI